MLLAVQLHKAVEQQVGSSVCGGGSSPPARFIAILVIQHAYSSLSTRNSQLIIYFIALQCVAPFKLKACDAEDPRI